MVVGARFDDDAGEASGSAYVFVRSGGAWSQQKKLTASDAAVTDEFGFSVAISGDMVVVGARFDDDAGEASGSAYVFVRSGGAWSQQQKLTASDAAATDEFGFSVAISGDTVVVGALFDSDAGDASGSAYVYGLARADVIVDFGSLGLRMLLNNSLPFVGLSGLSPEAMVVGDIDGNGQDDVIIDFGPAVGLWALMNNTLPFVGLSGFSPEAMVVGDIDGGGKDDVVIDFGPAIGLWVLLNNTLPFVGLSGFSPEDMVVGDIDGNAREDVVIDFGGAGLWALMNATQPFVPLSGFSPEDMVVGNIDGT